MPTGHQQESEINYSETILVHERAIEMNDPEAMNERAYMYQHGLGSEENYPAAICLYERASALGYAEAMHNRAYMYQHGLGSEVNYPAAIALYEQAIALNCVDAMNNRAYMHEYGLGGKINYSAAIYLYEQAISFHHAGAMANRAYMHQHGWGSEINYAAAIALYERAIALDYVEAMPNRAYMHQHGLGGGINYPAAIDLYERAIAFNHAGAMVNRAYMYEQGCGTTVNYPLAIYLYEKAIALGNQCALSYRAVIHERHQSRELAHQLLELIWDDLLSGQAISSFTVDLLKKYCKGAILMKQLTGESKDSLFAQIFGLPLLLEVKASSENAASFLNDYIASRIRHFTCIFTQGLINEPLTYEANGFQQVFERAPFKQWWRSNGTCPHTRINLNSLIITELDAEAEAQIQYLRPFVIRTPEGVDARPLNAEETEQLNDRNSPMFKWIRQEAIHAMERNDAKRIALFTNQLPLLKYFIAEDKQEKSLHPEEDRTERKMPHVYSFFQIPREVSPQISSSYAFRND